MNGTFKRCFSVLSLVFVGITSACSPPPLVCNSNEIPMGGRCVPAGADAANEAAVAMEAGSADAATDAMLIDVSTDREAAVDTCVPIEDLPDPDGLDTNCDGIDGDAANAIFVSASSAAGGDGSRGRPFRSLADGLSLARGGSKKQVLVALGEYQGGVVLPDGVMLAGGYDPTDWHVTTDYSAVSGACPVIAVRSTAGRMLRFSIRGADATTPGDSCIAAVFEDANGFVFTDSRVSAGRGAAGSAGMNGIQPVAAASGANGSAAVYAATPPLGPTWRYGRGGAMVTGGCASGGSGGNAYDGLLSLQAVAGSAGMSGGGTGGIAATVSRLPGNGNDGFAGSRGTTGLSATTAFCAMTSARYSSGCAAGANGTAGTAGTSGGGGGGGSTVPCDPLPPLFGGGGGAGGNAGCGGPGGSGGGAGGASIAVVVWGGSLSIQRVTLVTSGGGNGGNGGAGAEGGVGGAGGMGGGCSYLGGACTVMCFGYDAGILRGGNGGRGGAGGNGGAGGGGAGGPTVGLVVGGGATAPAALPTELGPAGAGGLPGDMVGSRGATGDRQDVLVVR